MNDSEIYEAYVRAFGKVRSGHKLTDQDFGSVTQYWSPYPEEGKIAVSLAAEDAAAQSPMRSKKALLESVRALAGG